MRLHSFTVALGLFAAFSAGCEAGTESPPPPPEVEVAEVADQLEAAVCDVTFDCACEYGRQFQTPSECTAWADQQQLAAEQLIAQGLVWDPTCVGWYVQGFEELGCGGEELLPIDVDGDGCNVQCAPLHGTVPVGGTCTNDNGFSNCARGLTCSGSACVDPCNGGAEGDACDGGNQICGDGLYCDFTDGEFQPRCRSKLAEGAECSIEQCAEGLSCVSDLVDPTLPQRCQALAELGGACMGHGECGSGYCPAGFCDLLPTEGGDCRGTGVCAAGFYCDGETCGALKQPGDPCTNGCGGGLECRDSVCEQVDSAVCYPGSIVNQWD